MVACLIPPPRIRDMEAYKILEHYFYPDNCNIDPFKYYAELYKIYATYNQMVGMPTCYYSKSQPLLTHEKLLIDNALVVKYDNDQFSSIYSHEATPLGQKFAKAVEGIKV